MEEPGSGERRYGLAHSLTHKYLSEVIGYGLAYTVIISGIFIANRIQGQDPTIVRQYNHEISRLNTLKFRVWGFPRQKNQAPLAIDLDIDAQTTVVHNLQKIVEDSQEARVYYARQKKANRASDYSAAGFLAFSALAEFFKRRRKKKEAAHVLDDVIS